MVQLNQGRIHLSREKKRRRKESEKQGKNRVQNLKQAADWCFAKVFPLITLFSHILYSYLKFDNIEFLKIIIAVTPLSIFDWFELF